jgi:hypothetical protein
MNGMAEKVAVNGHEPRPGMTVPFLPLVMPSGPAEPYPRSDGPAVPATAPEGRDASEPARPRRQWRPPSFRLPDGDAVITWSMAATVALVAVDAAIVSYSHIYGLATGQWGSGAETGVQARLLPLSIDGVIAEASLVKLYAARHKVTGKTRLATCMLWLGIVATVAANVTHGLPSSSISPVTHVVIMALLSAWPAGAFIGSVEMAMGLVRSMRDLASGGVTVPDDGGGTSVMTEAATPSPEPPAVVVTVPEGTVTRPAPRAVTRRPVKAAVTRGARPPADGKIASAIAADPSLATASISVMAKAAGVSPKSVERYRQRQREAAAST